MTRRTALLLTGRTLLGLVIAALPQVSSAQIVLPNGIFQLNLAKSKYSPGPAPKSQTLSVQGEGPNLRVTLVGIDAEGNQIAIVFMHVEDGQLHPITGAPGYDAQSITRVDAYTFSLTRVKAGKVVQTATGLVSPDGKTYTLSTTGAELSGRQSENIAVYEKQ